MQFKVPQFVETEDKIVGPLGIKQFLYLLGAAIVLIILWFLFSFAAFLILAIPIGGLALALAFAKVNGRPFVYFLLSVLKYLTRPKLYLWKKDSKKL